MPAGSKSPSFWKLSTDSGNKTWRVEARDDDWPRGIHERLRVGRPMKPGEWPSPPPEYVTRRYHGPDDVLDCNFTLVVSDRAREFFERDAPGALEFLPITLRPPEGVQLQQRYWAANWLSKVDALHARKRAIDPVRWPDDVPLALCHYPDPPKKSHGPDWPREMIVRSDFKRAFEDSGMRRLGFDKVRTTDPPKPRAFKDRTKQRLVTMPPEFDPAQVLHGADFDVDAFLAAGHGPNTVVDATGASALQSYCRWYGMTDKGCDERVVLKLLEADGDVRGTDRRDIMNPIFFDVVPKTDRIVRAFLARGADIDVRNATNMTSLHRAVEELQIDQVRLLLKHGANPNSFDLQPGGTILGDALMSRIFDSYGFQTSLKIGQVLIDAGADVNFPDGYRNSILVHLVERWGNPGAAVERRQRRVLKFLLDHGADPNAMFHRVKRYHNRPSISDGGTPLMSVNYGDGTMHRMLVEAGADPLRTDPKGKTAIDYVRRHLAKPGIADRRGAEFVLALMERAAARPKR